MKSFTFLLSLVGLYQPSAFLLLVRGQSEQRAGNRTALCLPSGLRRSFSRDHYVTSYAELVLSSDHMLGRSCLGLSLMCVLHACEYVPCMCARCLGRPEGSSRSPRTELRRAVSCLVAAQNGTCVLCKSSKCLQNCNAWVLSWEPNP